jgi:hypothetical protein
VYNGSMKKEIALDPILPIANKKEFLINDLY